MEFIGGECLAITKAIILINSLGDSDFVQKMPRGGTRFEDNRLASYKKDRQVYLVIITCIFTSQPLFMT